MAALVLAAVAAVAIWNGGWGSRGRIDAPTASLPDPPAWVSGPRVVSPVAAGDTPTPQPAQSSVPLGSPAPLAQSGGPHRFIVTQPESTEPVAYDPCRPIAVVVNDRTAPSDAAGIVEEALAEVSQATGLQFHVEGLSDEVPVSSRPAFQPDRYGDRWAPVLIAWSDPEELAVLDGSVAGTGGSNWISRDQASIPSVFVSGVVALDGPQLAETLARRKGRSHAKAIVLHELGHLVGLDHVDDPGQLMHPDGHPGIVTYQDGDLTGLARLGKGACLPEI